MKKTAPILISVIYFMFISLEVISQNSINLNGTTDYIAVQHNESLSIEGNFTLEAWIKPNDISGEKTILIKGNNGQCGNYGLFIKDGNLAYVSAGECGWNGRGPNSSLSVGVWQHVAAVGDGNNLSLYIDGELKDTIVLNSVVGPSNNAELWIGRSVVNTNNFFFNGLKDEIRIWGVAKSQTEIQSNINTELSGLESDVLLYYKLDDINEDCDISDCSINENHGARININNNTGLPQIVNDQPSNLTNVECGVVLSNCNSFGSVFQDFVDSVKTNLQEENANSFLNNEAQIIDVIGELQFYYTNRTQLIDPFYDFLTDLCTEYPQFFKINQIIDDIQFKYLGSFREQVHIYLRDYLRDYPDKEPQFIAALDLANPNASKYLEIWNDHQVLMIDNYSLNEAQLNVVHDLLSSIPDNITNLGVVMYREFYTNDFQNLLAITQSTSFINSFGWPIGSVPGDAFPEDFNSFVSDGFPIALSHEISHTIDADYIWYNTRLNSWKNNLLTAAGTTYNEYLRTRVLDIGGNDFFQISPQEFFASLANIYFSNSVLTLELAIERFNEGYQQPINQFLLMADALSAETNSTQVYVIDESSNIALSFHNIERNSEGFINAIYQNELCKIEFIYDENNFVIEIINSECIESLLDDDNDGVVNNIDQCANTAPGQMVDENGCEVFSFDAFKLYTESTACPGIANGLLEISVSGETDGYVFDVRVEGTGIDLNYEDMLSFNNTLSLSDMASGTYVVTISLESGFSIVFDQVVITETDDLTADKQKVNTIGKTAFYKVTGNLTYSVSVNRKVYSFKVDTKLESTITVPLEKGENNISIKGAECQSVFKDRIVLQGTVIYPNPINEGFYISGSYKGKVTLFTNSGNFIKEVEVGMGRYIDIQELPSGVYFVHFKNEKKEILKIIKQ